MEKLHRPDLQMEPEQVVEAGRAAETGGAEDNRAVQLSARQLRQLGEYGTQKAHATADAGVASAGTQLPHLEQIQASFGKHAVGGIRAHTGGQAAEASAALGATAYATGTDIAFAGAPDLHTAAHEAAHVVQQQAGVQLKGGFGRAGDAYESHADAVADAVVRGESAEGLLSQMAGSSSTAGAVQSRDVQLLGVPLNEQLPEGQAEPEHGEVPGKQRKWSPEQYIAMWEAEQGRKMTPQERTTIKRGCIGITATNLQGGGNPLDYAEKTYGNFEQAQAYMVEKNKMLDADEEAGAGAARYVVFAKLFWSNQADTWEERLKPDDNAFKPDPKTGEVDMSSYEYKAQSKWGVDEEGKKKKSSYINFDYGFWDDASHCFWHANHMDYGDPARPMIVLQSTRDKFAAGYLDFDRIIYCVARAENYDPAAAAMAHAGGGR